MLAEFSAHPEICHFFLCKNPYHMMLAYLHGQSAKLLNKGIYLRHAAEDCLNKKILPVVYPEYVVYTAVLRCPLLNKAALL